MSRCTLDRENRDELFTLFIKSQQGEIINKHNQDECKKCTVQLEST